MKASDLANALGAPIIHGSADLELSGMSTLTEAGPGDVAFITDKKYLSQAQNSKAALILTSERLPLEGRPHISLKNVWSGVLTALKLFYPAYARKHYTGVHPTAVIDETARLGKDVAVGPYAVIGAETLIGDNTYIAPGVVIGPRCKIGANVTIYANAVIEAESRLGNNVYIQPGAVIGADGFKYEMLEGRWTKIPQVGHVELGDGAEVGANTCIDRASYSVTAVGPNSKIDNLVQIGHNTRVGQNCVIVSQTGIAGSTTVGDHSILAAQVGIADNITIGDQTVLMARTGVMGDIAGGGTYWGFPAHPFAQEGRIQAVKRKLPDLASQVAQLTRRIAELEARLDEKSK